MAKATEQEVRQVILEIASARKIDVKNVMSGAVNSALQQKGLDPWGAPEISQLKNRIAAESGPIDLAYLKRINSLDIWASVSLADGKMPAVEDFDHYWWFQYFYFEAFQAAQREPEARFSYSSSQKMADQQELVKLVQRMFTKGKPFLTLKPEYVSTVGPAPAKATPSWEQWRDAMATLLEIGFRRVPASDLPPDAQAQELRGEVSVESQANFMLQKQYVGHLSLSDVRKGRSEVRIGWRSETRPLSMVQQHGGNKRQSDVKALASDMNMDMPWHPFSNPDINKYLWFRLTNTDNDYYTVISVANDFRTCTSFPKIDERRVYKFPNKDVTRWTAQEAESFKDHLALVEVRDKGLEKRVMLLTRTYAYLYGITGLYVDTKEAGGAYANKSFPEIGVKDIPMDAIFGVLSIIRIHHGPTDVAKGQHDPGDGFTVFIQKSDAKMANSHFKLEFRYGRKGYETLVGEFEKRRDLAPFGTAWSAGGFKAPNHHVDVVRIVEYPLSQGSMAAFKKSLPARA